MTKRLYYDQPDLLEFDSAVEEVRPAAGEELRHSFTLRESAFYPTSGGQVHDTGWVTLDGGTRLKVGEIVEAEDGRIVHYLEGATEPPAAGMRVHGTIDADRRRDHMQQHTGQHVLSAAFIELYQFPTVSFHMGDDYCSIDLATPALSQEQVVGAEKRANEIIFENRGVTIRYVSRAEAETLGLRKLPPAERDELRLIEIANFDLSACGGTHVFSTGQIGSILLRKVERTRQGMRVEFVCGGRAVRTARRDYGTLVESAALYSAQIWDLPGQIRKSSDDVKAARKEKEEALEQLAGAMAEAALREFSIRSSSIGSSEPARTAASTNRPVIVRVFADRDAAFAKLFAQKIVRSTTSAVALVGSTMNPPGVVFAQSTGGSSDIGALLKQELAAVGGRGGGSRDFAQGGVPAGVEVEKLLRQAASRV